jgi:hypothetical protein
LFGGKLHIDFKEWAHGKDAEIIVGYHGSYPLPSSIYMMVYIKVALKARYSCPYRIRVFILGGNYEKDVNRITTNRSYYIR